MDKTSTKYLYVKFNRDANCFFPVECKDLSFPLRISMERCRQEEKRNLFPSEWWLSTWKPLCSNKYEICLPEMPAQWWCHLQSTCFFGKTVQSQNMPLCDLIQTICIDMRFQILKMQEFRIILVSLLYKRSFRFRLQQTQWFWILSICTIVADFSPEFNPPFCWLSKHQIKKWLFISIIWSLLSLQLGPVEVQGNSLSL